jgi:hypothetical protein
MFLPVYSDTRGPTSCTPASIENGSRLFAGERNRLFISGDETAEADAAEHA